jgi:putative ABC transport system permease protein
VAAPIDGLFKNSMAETLTETEKAFQLGFVAMSEAIIIAIQAVSFVVIIIILAVTANTMAMSARERTGEYAVLKTLGFGARHIALLIFGESFLITLTGCLLGVICTVPAADAFGKAMGNFLPVFNVSRLTIGLDFLFSLVVALTAGIIPAYRAVTVPIAQGLRKIV